MKKFLVIIFLVCCKTIIFAQIPGPDPLTPSDKASVITNKVHSSCCREYKVIGRKEVPKKGCDSLVYDQKGNLIRESYLFVGRKNKLRSEVFTFGYDEKGRIHERKMVDYGQKKVVEEVAYERYFYNEEGKIEKTLQYNSDPITTTPEDSILYEYENGQLKKQIGTFTHTYEYINDTAYEYSPFDHRLVAGYVKDRMIFLIGMERTIIYKYDANGLFMGVKYIVDGKKTFESFWEYENGLPIKITSHEHEKLTDNIQRYTYTYYP